MGFGGVFETRPQKKVAPPFPTEGPEQTGDLKLNLIELLVWTAEASPIVPTPPVEITKT